MNTKTFTDAEKTELRKAAQIAVETESPWVQLGEYFRAQRERASQKVEARPTRKSD